MTSPAELLAGFKPFPVALVPTPLHSLEGLRRVLGDSSPRILIKRDDLTGLALGGNKARKLGYLLADARMNGADTIITCGAGQSNHALQAAMAARRFGFDVCCVLYGEPPERAGGNLLLHQLIHTDIVWTTMLPAEHRREEAMQRTMRIVEDRLASLGKRVYAIPTGGSSALGALGYVEAMLEIKDQYDGPLSGMYFASGSGGTHAGVMAGAAMAQWSMDLVGVEVDPIPADAEGSSPYHRFVEHLTMEVLDMLQMNAQQLTAKLQFEDAHTGDAYGSPSSEGTAAMELLASTEGIVLDPVYTAKAMAALISAIRSGQYGAKDTVLFWHTGGVAGLFAGH